MKKERTWAKSSWGLTPIPPQSCSLQRWTDRHQTKASRAKRKSGSLWKQQWRIPDGHQRKGESKLKLHGHSVEGKIKCDVEGSIIEKKRRWRRCSKISIPVVRLGCLFFCGLGKRYLTDQRWGYCVEYWKQNRQGTRNEDIKEGADKAFVAGEDETGGTEVLRTWNEEGGERSF